MDVDLGFDKERLGGFIKRVQDDPAAGGTVWTATTHWQHGFKSEATIRSHRVRMDEPAELMRLRLGPPRWWSGWWVTSRLGGSRLAGLR